MIAQRNLETNKSYYKADITDACMNLEYYIKYKNEINYTLETINNIKDYIQYCYYFVNENIDNIYIKKLSSVDIVNLGFSKMIDFTNDNISKNRFTLYDVKGEISCKLFIKEEDIVTLLNNEGYTIFNGKIKNIFQLYDILLMTLYYVRIFK